MWQELALEIAKKAHDGQVDKGGCAYIGHPLAVAAKMDTDEEKAVALLHDVVEDSPYTLEDLRKAGFPCDIVDAVGVLTKKKGADYAAYLNEVKKNPLARKVKMEDLRHNMDVTRLPMLTGKDRQRMGKYQNAMNYLNK